MTSNAAGGIRILGSLRAASGTGVVRIEDRFNTDIDDLWSALTDPARLARWHGQVEGDLRPGGEFRVYLEADEVESTGRVERCEPPRRLLVTTRETDDSYRKGQGVPPFDEVIEVMLTAGGDQTILRQESCSSGHRHGRKIVPKGGRRCWQLSRRRSPISTCGSETSRSQLADGRGHRQDRYLRSANQGAAKADVW